MLMRFTFGGLVNICQFTKFSSSPIFLIWYILHVIFVLLIPILHTLFQQSQEDSTSLHEDDIDEVDEDVQAEC